MRHLLALAVLGLASLGPALASLNDAAACSPPYEPQPITPRAAGIHRVAVSTRGNLARDGGILMEADVVGVDMPALLTKVTAKVSAGGAPVSGEVRAFTSALASERSLMLQFVPTGGLLPVTNDLQVELAYEPATGAEAPSAFKGQVDNVLLTDLALPEIDVALAETVLMPDAGSPMIRCVLEQPQKMWGGGCGGDDASPTTLTETKFASRQRRQQVAVLHASSRFNYGVERYVKYQSRLNWPGDAAGWDMGGYFSERHAIQVPEAADGEICFEVVADSTTLPGFPKTVTSCKTLPALAPITAAEDEAYFDKETKGCRELIAPPGVTLPASVTTPTTSSGAPGSANNGADAASDDESGCSVHGAPIGRASSWTSASGLLLGLAFLARRRTKR